jgi:hypothetical protein
MAGLMTGGLGDARNSALFDNLIINTVNGPKPPPTVFAQDAHPMYDFNQNPATVMSAYADDFNSGSPEAKNLWDQVVASVNSGDYATALSTLEQLQTDDGLPPRQKQAVQETEAAVKKQMGDSAKTVAPSQ